MLNAASTPDFDEKWIRLTVNLCRHWHDGFMALTNKQQFVICSMVNADPTYIPEKETAEEKNIEKS